MLKWQPLRKTLSSGLINQINAIDTTDNDSSLGTSSFNELSGRFTLSCYREFSREVSIFRVYPLSSYSSSLDKSFFNMRSNKMPEFQSESIKDLIFNLFSVTSFNI